MSLDFTNDQSTLVRVMAWCRQATSHYLSQCWARSRLPSGVTRPQWVNIIHLPTVKAIHGDCQWPLMKIKRWKFLPVTCAHNALHLRSSPSIFASANHTVSNKANRRPCLIAHWQFYCHQTRTVKQSNIGQTMPWWLWWVFGQKSPI